MKKMQSMLNGWAELFLFVRSLSLLFCFVLFTLYPTSNHVIPIVYKDLF